MLTEDFSNLIKKRQYPEICRDERELIELFKTVKHSKNDVNKMLADAWLGIYVNDDTLFNPLNNLPPQAAENFTQYLVWLMSQPDYFYFIIKCLFNMDSFPFQCLLLRELFNHKYPLLIGARGLSKCVVGDSMVVTNSGVKNIIDLTPEEIEQKQQKCPYQAYGETGYRDIDYSFYNGVKPTKKIKTKSGRILEGTLNHPIRIVRDGNTKWVNMEDIAVGDFAVIERNYQEWGSNNLDKDVAYMIGAIVGDGCYTSKSRNITFTNIDQECIDNVNKGLKKYFGTELKYVNSTRDNNAYRLPNQNKELQRFIKDFGCNSYDATTDKLTPKIIFGSSFEAIAEYLSGLFDTDGCCHTRSPVVELSSKSRKLLEETQFLLLVLGINSTIKDQYNKKYKKYYYKILISGSSMRKFNEKIKFRITRKQELLEKHCLQKSNNNIDLVPRELFLEKLLVLRELARDTVLNDNKDVKIIKPDRLKRYDLQYSTLRKCLDLLSKSDYVKNSQEYTDLCKILGDEYIYDKIISIEDSENKTYDIHIDNDDHSFITNGFISHNTSTLALYLLISMIIRPNIKIVITGAGFRQAKLVFEEMEKVWQRSPVLRSCFPGRDPITHGTDSWKFRLGGSITHALPTGPDGSKVRGYRANILLCVHGSTVIETDKGFIPISEFDNAGATFVRNEYGQFEKPELFFETEPQDVYFLETDTYRTLLCSAHHQIRNGKNEWIKVPNLTIDENVLVTENGITKTESVRVLTKLPNKQILYDFVMPESHSFIGNGFLNHNCDEFACTRKSFIQTDLGLKRIEDIVNNKLQCNVINSNGEYEPIIDWIKTPKTDVYRLTTKYNYEIEFSEKHMFMLEDGTWKKGIDLTTSDKIRFENRYVFPKKEYYSYKTLTPNQMAYLGGLLISEGDLSSKYRISITSIDKKFVDDFCEEYKILNPNVYTRKAYVDHRGWNCKECYHINITDSEFRKFLFEIGYNYNTAINKTIPENIMSGSRETVQHFLRGLFWGDGSVFAWEDKLQGKTRLGVAYYTASKEMIDQLHILLKSMGYISFKTSRRSKISDNDQWMIRLNGQYAVDFVKEINYDKHMDVIAKTDVIKKKKRGCIHLSKNHTEKCGHNRYITCIHSNGSSNYLGIFDTVEESQNAIDNFLKTEVSAVGVKKIEKLDEQDHLYDISLPSTHSYYANGLVNHNSTNRTVFEEVMGGFLSVAANPIEQIHKAAKSDLIKTLPNNLTSHILQDEDNDPYALSNQLILAGTAYYKHNHFYTYYNKWRQIISSAGDKKQLEEILGGDYDPNTFNWKDYSVIRIPIKLSTKGFMDMSQVSRTKASTSKDVYAREFDCIFTDDSDGFYRRSIIDSCTVSEKNIIKKNDEEIKFGAVLYGDPNKKYIYGVDPAYEGDNFAIVILECEPDYRKVVHVWTTQASDHKQLLADNIITENDYYHYAARKIRNLMKRFPCAYIAIDTQGGGRAVIEALSDNSKLEPGERMILPYIDPTQAPKDTDCLEGDHIIYEVKPTSDWNIEANHSLKKDMEMKDIIFPAHDGISYTMAEFYDNNMGAYSGLYDTLEDCIFEIEELKNELTMIVVTETATGKQRFDTPEIKIGITKKGKLKKDRYSALLMANYVARNMDVLIPRRISGDMFGEGGFAKPSVFIAGNNSIGNPNIINQFEQLYDAQLSARPKH